MRAFDHPRVLHCSFQGSLLACDFSSDASFLVTQNEAATCFPEAHNPPNPWGAYTTCAPVFLACPPVVQANRQRMNQNRVFSRVEAVEHELLVRVVDQALPMEAALADLLVVATDQAQSLEQAPDLPNSA